jgi:lysophospholipid hydrolase
VFNIIISKMDCIYLVGSWQQPNLKHTMDAPPSQVNFSTVAIVPISDDVPLTAFTYELYHSLCAIGKLLLLFKNNGHKPC